MDTPTQIRAPHTKGMDAKPHDKHLPSGVLETEQERAANWYVGSIDQGTTSSRFIIFNGEGNPVASHQIEFENKYPTPGSVTVEIAPPLERLG
jgi:hypothetical protein